jgi:hypothetical protein
MRYGVVVLVIVGLLLVAVRQAATPPQFSRVEVIVRQLIPIEEKIEGRDWIPAGRLATAVGRQLEELRPDLEPPASQDLAKAQSLLASLERKLESGEASESYQAYFDLRQQLFDLLDEVGYPSAPILLVARHDLDQGREAAGKRKWEDVAHELQEVEISYRSALPVLVEKGISQQQTADVLVKLSQLRDAMQDGEWSTLPSRLQELDLLLEQQQNGETGD